MEVSKVMGVAPNHPRLSILGLKSMVSEITKIYVNLFLFLGG